MTDIVRSIDPSTIASVIEANINAYLLSFARIPGSHLRQDSQCAWVDSGIADSTFNSVVLARFSPESVAAEIETILAHFRARSLPFTWHIGPGSGPPDLGDRLLAHGLNHDEDEPGMAVDLDRARDDFAIPSGLEITPVRDQSDLREWVNVWLFGAPPHIREIYFGALRQRGLGDDLPWHYYLGRVAGRPVAISELFMGEGVASVQYVVTVPEVRRRGIGAALTQHVTREARARGYRVAVLTASPSGIGIYRRMGLKAYCWFHRYTWDPPSEASPTPTAG